MSETRMKNPVKETAVNLAHMMDYNKKAWEMRDWEREAFRKEYDHFINTEIIAKGYDITMLMHLAEIYKKLSMKDYYEWIYS